MTLKSIPVAGASVEPHVKQLQGLQFNLLTGGLANAKLNVAAIRSGATILAALNNAAGTITDIASTLTIVDCRASGTLTISGGANGNACVVQGVTYTLRTTAAVGYTNVQLGADDTETAANLAAAITANENSPPGLRRFFATSALGVVTIRANAEGTGPNAYTIVGGTHITASGATLAGGTATGGIKSSGATDQVILMWYPKS